MKTKKKRIKDLHEARDILSVYAKQENISILFWSLCQFEKRKNVPTEEDYYIERYGIKEQCTYPQPKRRQI